MAQTKKPEVREAILAAAATQFRTQGYAATSLAGIAREAGISTSNVYVYFEGKLAILFALAGPWLLARMDALADMAAGQPDPRERLRGLFLGLWARLPADDAGYAPLLMEALATLGPEEAYSRALLGALEESFTTALRQALPGAEAAHLAVVARLAFMAFDGFAINRRLQAATHHAEDAATLMCDLLLRAGQPSARG